MTQLFIFNIEHNISGQEISAVCNVSYAYARSRFLENLPLIYLVTPTYTRGEQVAELTRFESCESAATGTVQAF